MPDINDTFEALKARCKREGFVLTVTVVPGTRIDPEKVFKARWLNYNDESLEDSLKTIGAYLDTEEAKDKARLARMDEVWEDARNELEAKHTAEIMTLAVPKLLERYVIGGKSFEDLSNDLKKAREEEPNDQT